MVSRWTALAVHDNEGVYVEADDRVEYWMTKEGQLHAKLLSCPKDKRHELEAAVNDIKTNGCELSGRE